jgi:hypothetical protein
VWVPPVEKLVVVVAKPFASVTGLSAVPSIVNVTVPVGAAVPVLWVTVAVSVTVTPVAGLEGEAATVVVVPALAATEVNAVARLDAFTEPNPVAWSYPVSAE